VEYALVVQGGAEVWAHTEVVASASVPQAAVAEVVMFPHYMGCSGQCTTGGDLALIFLADDSCQWDVTTPKLNAMPELEMQGENITILGWGKDTATYCSNTDPDSDSQWLPGELRVGEVQVAGGGRAQDCQLAEANQDVANDTICYEPNYQRQESSHSAFCAGDLGGPGVIYTNESGWVVVGINSFSNVRSVLGTESLDRNGLRMVASKISYFTAWLQETLRNHDRCAEGALSGALQGYFHGAAASQESGQAAAESEPCFCSAEMRYDHTRILDPKLTMWWSVDGDSVHIKLELLQVGWVGVGVSGAGGMVTSDVVIGRADFDITSVTATDSYARIGSYFVNARGVNSVNNGWHANQSITRWSVSQVRANPITARV
jgi:hypothetical protein